ncbi:hypothetical protein, partial [Bacillus pumilus]|uniref:hypothetical protein n=1 Tax=Bacillus pumilus TaxID=1408 RepID=UPI001C92EA44
GKSYGNREKKNEEENKGRCEEVECKGKMVVRRGIETIEDEGRLRVGKVKGKGMMVGVVGEVFFLKGGFMGMG